MLIARGALNRNLRDFRIELVNDADMAVNLEVNVEVDEGVTEGAFDSRSRCEVSSEQFSEELSPVDPVEP